MRENAEKFNEMIKNTIAHLAEKLLQKGTFPEFKVSIKQFWPDYSGDVLFTAGSLPDEEEYFNIEVSTETGISDSSQFYRGNHEALLNFLKDSSNLGIIIEKVSNMGMYLLIEEDRLDESGDDWE